MAAKAATAAPVAKAAVRNLFMADLSILLHRVVRTDRQETKAILSCSVVHHLND